MAYDLTIVLCDEGMADIWRLFLRYGMGEDGFLRLRSVTNSMAQ
jgi:hypothetical protein